ncbi:hypothetical protein [Halobellus ordinarius]|uniref:hypothetical protein n=1 Tax=Halobellus ordinarius TaxID=3075120 RepID=UPI0028804A4B|nr:hypothetical protein [Halobellus sp. ZY16]
MSDEEADDGTDRSRPFDETEADDPAESSVADPTLSDQTASDHSRPPSDGAGEHDRAVDGAADGEDDVPLADLARRISDRNSEGPGTVEPEPGEDGATDGPFEEMSVSEIDEETLWSSLGAADDPTAGVGIGEPAEPVSESDREIREYVVSKAKYCQKCPHLSDPPNLTCTHEGTEIVEVVDSEHFRVRNCPIVEDNRVGDEG